MFRNKVTWSPVEVEYLKSHPNDALDQLCIALAKSRNAIKLKRAELSGKPIPIKKKPGARSKIGKRADLGVFLRSAWEANVYRVLQAQHANFLYEPKVFSFTEFGIKHGTTSYTPDFYMTDTCCWIEVKGYLKPEDKVKLRRFKKFYPAEFSKLYVVVASPKTAAAKFFEKLGIPVWAYYEDLKKNYSFLSGWET